MAKYVKLNSEFLEFVKAVAKDVDDDYEKKLINLIINHFDEVASVGTGHGKRAELLNELIQKEGESVSDSLSVVEEDQKQDTFPFTALSSIEVEHFRGFAHKESIPFDKRFTFIYGPNGSGKSSLCEALEYTMLGYINEAIARRIDVKRYIRNSFTGKGEDPILKGQTADDKSVTITPDPSLGPCGHHFIQGFSRSALPATG